MVAKPSLSREESAERASRVAAAVAEGAPVQCVADEFGISVGTVYDSCRRKGVVLRRSDTLGYHALAAARRRQVVLLDRSHDETAELAAKVFELSQTLQNTWVSADYATKRRILEIVCLNCTLDGASAVFTTRKPFDVLIEGLYSQTNRADRI